MPGNTKFVYWDSCIFLSYINADPGRIDILEGFLDEIQKSNGERKIVTSILTKVEVAWSAIEQISQELSSAVEQKIDALWNDESVIGFIEVHEGIVLGARALMRQSLTQGWSLKPPDAIHLASAQWLGVEELHTYDDKLPRYGTMIGCKICEPSITQLRLNLDTGMLPQ
jgi:predicted nucleic acid-binding protein